MQTFEATVVSNKTTQTVTVTTDYIFRHPKYKKILKRTTKLAAHNDIPDIKIGDKVRLIKSRPYSKTKHFKVTEII